MLQLSLDQYDILQRYVELLNTIEEAFDHVIGSFEDPSRENADQVLSDIFSAFSSIYQTNQDLLVVFNSESRIIENINYFDGVVAEVGKLEGAINDLPLKQDLLKSNVYPAFLAWKEGIEKELSIYIVH